MPNFVMSFKPQECYMCGKPSDSGINVSTKAVGETLICSECCTSYLMRILTKSQMSMNGFKSWINKSRNVTISPKV